ncbi:MAG: hypothetical protein BWY78_00492 [Alphaproteobacteria bacterium ADurb.Bin438]|nr:MAG: hypothetical protein BWY78_00492 [Alphaproteobacteria bacterium ADurb.Bin438]
MFNFIKNIKITKKLPIFVMLIGGLSLFITISISYKESKEQLINEAQQRLIAVGETRTINIKNYLNDIKDDLIYVSQNITTADSLKLFEKAFNDFGQDALKTLHNEYIYKNPNPQ